MKSRIFPFLAFTLLLAPGFAHASYTYKCRPIDRAVEMGATLRFDSNGKGGHLNLELWNGYPPITLINADFKRVAVGQESNEFQSETDNLWGRSAKISAPGDFLKQDYFVARITQIKKDGALRADDFGCNRF